MKKLIALTSLVAMAFAIHACNTMQGMGQDVKAGGNKIEDAADDNRVNNSTNANTISR